MVGTRDLLEPLFYLSNLMWNIITFYIFHPKMYPAYQLASNSHQHFIAIMISPPLSYF